MGAADLLATIFVSIAVVITVIAQLATIWDFVGGRRPRFDSPIIAFLGLIPFLTLLSLVVAINIVPGSNDLATANGIAQVAVLLACVPYGSALVVSLVWYVQSTRGDARYSHYDLTFAASLVLGGILLSFLFLVSIPLPSYAPFAMAFMFTLIPVGFSWRGWNEK